KRLKKNQSIVVFVSSSNHDTVDLDSIRVKRKTLQNLLDDCHRAPELLNLADTAPSGDRTETGGSGEDYSNPVGSSESPSSDSGDPEAEKDFSSRRFAFFSGFCNLLVSWLQGTCFKQSLNLPNLKLWITGSLLNQVNFMDVVYALKRQDRTLYGVGRGCFLCLTLLLAVKEKIIVYSSAKAFRGSKKGQKHCRMTMPVLGHFRAS
ncbi:unnamed protein product, partial [Brassica oleracea var. botrytis]